MAYKTGHYKRIETLCEDQMFDGVKQILVGMSKKSLDYNEDLFIEFWLMGMQIVTKKL